MVTAIRTGGSPVAVPPTGISFRFAMVKNPAASNSARPTIPCTIRTGVRVTQCAPTRPPAIMAAMQPASNTGSTLTPSRARNTPDCRRVGRV